MSDEQSLIKKVWSWIKKHINIHNSLLCGIVILFCLFIFVMYSSRVACIFMNSTGITDKPELLKFIGWGIGGFIATLGAVGLMKRTIAFDEQNKIAEKGHIHDRFKAASEHLGNVKSASGRIASFHEFYRLAEITAKMPEEKGLKETIFDLLCAHLRQTTKEKDYKSNPKPTEEVQSLLDVLFKPKNKKNFIFIFRGLEANLAEAHLQGANLEYAELQGANLEDANLQGANLREANLQESANLQGANLQGANLEGANLEDAKLEYADLQGANLEGANLEGAKLQYANLQYANLQKANLQKANLEDAELQDTNLQGAKLQGANLEDAKMQKANLEDANLQYANLQYARMQEAKLQNANLQGANLQEVNLQGAQRHESIEMPDGWKDMVEKDNDGKTGLVIMNDKGEVIERL